MKRYFRKYIYLWFFIIAVTYTLPAIAASPQEALKSLLDSKAIDANQTAVYIWDLDADYQIAAHNTKIPLTPASIMKCISTASLHSVMSYKETLNTDVYVNGAISDSVLNGSLIIVGSGDPSLGDGRHKSQPDFAVSIAEALRNNGIKEIYGDIRIDDSLFSGPAVHPSWEQADLSQSYGTGCHAFNYGGNSSGKKSVADPSAIFLRRLSDTLGSNGIIFTRKEGAVAGGKKKLLLSYPSPLLEDLMASCMFRSDNLYAESFLRLFGVGKGKDGSIKQSALAAMRHWEALDFSCDGVEIADGSGLSRLNRLTAEFLGNVLIKMKDDPVYVSFFPLVGEEGTVRNFLRDTPLQGYMALKTGSMNGIQSYAGYVLDEDFQPTHVVVVITNNLKNRAAFKSALSSFFLSLFR